MEVTNFVPFRLVKRFLFFQVVSGDMYHGVGHSGDVAVWV